MNKILEWFKLHWHGRIFKLFVILGLFDIYLIIFHNIVYVQFVKFIFLVALEQLITNIVNNNTLISGIGFALAPLMPLLIKKLINTKKKDDENNV